MKSTAQVIIGQSTKSAVKMIEKNANAKV